MSCDCPEFRKDLMNCTKEVLNNGNGMSQWRTFEQFLRKYIGDIFSNEITFRRAAKMPCSQQICYLFAINCQNSDVVMQICRRLFWMYWLYCMSKIVRDFMSIGCGIFRDFLFFRRSVNP